MGGIDTLVYGCLIVSMNEKGVIEDGAIAMKDRRIVFVSKSSAVAGMKAEKMINAKGETALPCAPLQIC